MTDDDLWTQLRSDLAPSGDLDPARASAITARAHARLAHPGPTLRGVIRALEPFAVAGVAVAQLTWAWSVVLH